MKVQRTFGLSCAMALLIVVGVSIIAIPAAWAQQTVVDFDHPAPPGEPGDLLKGTFQGINFGKHKWRWVGPDQPGAGIQTNHIFFAHGKQRTFTFKPAPRILKSLVAYIYVRGDITVSDDKGQKVVLKRLQPGKHTVVTYWTMGSTRVKVRFSARGPVDVDDIIHASVDSPEVATCPCDYADALQTYNASVQACGLLDDAYIRANFSDGQMRLTIDRFGTAGCAIIVNDVDLFREPNLTSDETKACLSNWVDIVEPFPDVYPCRLQEGSGTVPPDELP